MARKPSKPKATRAKSAKAAPKPRAKAASKPATRAKKPAARAVIKPEPRSRAQSGQGAAEAFAGLIESEFVADIIAAGAAAALATLTQAALSKKKESGTGQTLKQAAKAAGAAMTARMAAELDEIVKKTKEARSEEG